MVVRLYLFFFLILFAYVRYQPLTAVFFGRCDVGVKMLLHRFHALHIHTVSKHTISQAPELKLSVPDGDPLMVENFT